MAAHPHRQHVKWLGWIDTIAPDKATWWGRIVRADDHARYPYEAEFTEPLPKHARPGSYFSIHRTKRGRMYFYWITLPLITKRQAKKARIYGRDMARWLQEQAA